MRGLVVDETGQIVSAASTAYVHLNLANKEKHYEQSATMWVDAVANVIKQCIQRLKNQGFTAEDIAGVGVDGTSGTIVPLAADHQPITNALMYNDARSDKEAEQVQMTGEALARKLGYRFKPTFALPKILWIKQNQPDIFSKTWCFLHQADYIIGYLTGNFRNSDYSNALKSGYDLFNNCWPGFIESELDIPLEKFPKVATPGTVIGTISKVTAQATGLSPRTWVCVGATDGTAAALASGIKKPGDYNTTIGTTLVIKSLTRSIIKDKLGRLYSHRHPDGYWIPGGASNTGGVCLNHHFGESNFKDLDRQVDLKNPSGVVCYPLVGKGERFPFVASNAKGFVEGPVDSDLKFYPALLEGVAYVERLAYDVMEDLGCDRVDTIYTAGGAVKSTVWVQLRANILKRRLLVPRVVEAAMGAAILAASTIEFDTVSEAVEAMVTIDKEVLPDLMMGRKYDPFYGRFLDACIRQGYIKKR